MYVHGGKFSEFSRSFHCVSRSGRLYTLKKSALTPHRGAISSAGRVTFISIFKLAHGKGYTLFRVSSRYHNTVSNIHM